MEDEASCKQGAGASPAAPSLRPYQEEAVARILQSWEANDRVLLVLPTGCGKTIVFSEIARRRLASPGGRILVLAHRDELLGQAAGKLQASTGIRPGLEKGRIHSDPADPIVVASVQTLARSGRLDGIGTDSFSTLIIDEAHHSLASSYQKIMSAFPKAKILGATATPERRDGGSLGRIFSQIAYEYRLVDAVRDGWLANPVVQTCPLKIDLSGARMSCGDFVPESSAEALEPCLEAIAREIAERCAARRTVIFTPLVKISVRLQAMLEERGLPCAEINGKSEDRSGILRAFEEGRFKALCNSMLLTEGWDCPRADCIVVLRPTRSKGLYAQMIGRGMRLCEGKENLLILDFLWLAGNRIICHPASLISSSDQDAEAITSIIGGKGSDGAELLAAQAEQEEIARRERLKAFSRMLMSNRLLAEGTYDKCLEIYSLLADFGLADFEPKRMPERPTDKQISCLAKWGLADPGYPPFSKEFASSFIGLSYERMDRGLCTFKQFRLLRRFGFIGVQDWTFKRASTAIGIIHASGWKADPVLVSRCNAGASPENAEQRPNCG